MIDLSAALWIARREWLEHRRQPWMLAAIGTLQAIVAGLTVFGVAALDWVQRHAEGTDLVAQAVAVPPAELAASVLTTFDFLAFTQFLGIAAVASGHALLHDRQCGTLTFLLLAPVGRLELLLGKVAGALGWPLLLYLIVDGTAALALCAFPVARTAPELLPLSPAFHVALLLGAPAWAAFLGAVGTLLSAVASDVRAAQQGVWFAVFFTSLAAGGLLTWSLTAGVALELAVALLGATAAAATLIGGSSVLAKDLGR